MFSLSMFARSIGCGKSCMAQVVVSYALLMRWVLENQPKRSEHGVFLYIDIVPSKYRFYVSTSSMWLPCLRCWRLSEEKEFGPMHGKYYNLVFSYSRTRYLTVLVILETYQAGEQSKSSRSVSCGYWVSGLTLAFEGYSPLANSILPSYLNRRERLARMKDKLDSEKLRNIKREEI